MFTFNVTVIRAYSLAFYLAYYVFPFLYFSSSSHYPCLLDFLSRFNVFVVRSIIVPTRLTSYSVMLTLFYSDQQDILSITLIYDQYKYVHA